MYSSGMRPHGSPEELERRRRRAVDLLKAGTSITEVARRLGCSHSSVILWRGAVCRRGPPPLKPTAAPGRPPKLTPRQPAEVAPPFLSGAPAGGVETEIWAQRRVAPLI